MHDCDYVTRRNALIPAAKRAADREVGVCPERGREASKAEEEAWADRWNRAFLGNMDALARGAGLL